MKLIIGGSYSGKLDYVLENSNFTFEDIVNCNDYKEEDLVNKAVIYNFHLLIRKLLEENDNEDIVKGRVNMILRSNPNVIIIMNEVGYGIVPIEKFDRRYRELVGRIGCILAKEAEEVIRVVAGIGGRIK